MALIKVVAGVGGKQRDLGWWEGWSQCSRGTNQQRLRVLASSLETPSQSKYQICWLPSGALRAPRLSASREQLQPHSECTAHAPGSCCPEPLCGPFLEEVANLASGFVEALGREKGLREEGRRWEVGRRLASQIRPN